MRSVIAISLLTMVLALWGAASAQSIPRTGSGAPDLSGVWDANFLTPLERPDYVKDLIVPKGEAAALIKKLTPDPGKVYDPDFHYFFPDTLLEVNGDFRSSWVVEPHDGRLPLTALGRMARDHEGELSQSGFDNPEERPGNERCVSGFGHPPLHATGLVIPNVIIQTPGAIAVVTEDTDSTRIISIGSAAPPAAVRSRLGFSAGRWEDDTLVVETTGIAAADPAGILSRDAVVVGRASRIIERFRLLSADELLYQFTVEDPALYDRPWLGEYVLKRIDGRIYEYACHEGNRSLPSVLRAARLNRQDAPKEEKEKTGGKK